MTTPRIVCLGEALIDLIGVDAEGRKWRAVPGGAPCNTAVAAGRLGAPTTFLGVLSEDRFGRMLRSHLDGARVDHHHCPIVSTPTSVAFTAGPDEPTTFHLAATTTTSSSATDLHLPPDVGILHVSGSVALVLEPVASRLEGLLAAAAHRAILHVDANPRAGVISREKYLRRFGHWLQIADVIQISEAAMEWMSPGADAAATARLWVSPSDPDAHSPAVVVLTRGSRGASVIRPDGVIEVDAPEVHVVDSVGAGDVLGGAVLAALSAHGVDTRAKLDRRDLRWWETAVGYAVRAASYSCTRPGAAAPRPADLQGF